MGPGGSAVSLKLNWERVVNILTKEMVRRTKQYVTHHPAPCGMAVMSICIVRRQDKGNRTINNREGGGASRSGGFASGNERSTAPKQMAQPSGSGVNNGSQQSYSSQRFVKKETAVTQLSPVKKRIKENKDHYIVADNYAGASSSSSRPVSGCWPGTTGPEATSGGHHHP